MKFLAIFGGMLVAVMVTLNGELSRNYPPFFSVLIFNFVGLIGILVVVFINRSDFRKFKNNIPIYFFLPGVMSIVLTVFNNLCIREIGVSITLALAIVGQSLFSTVVDSFGLLSIKKTPFDKRKMFGFFIICCGIFCLVYF